VFFVSEDVPDPRETGRNYRVLASNFPESAAREIALFLGERGIGMVVVPSGRGGYAVTTLRGTTREEHRNRGQLRLAIEDAVRRIGREYEAQGGSTDFSDAYWDRLD